MVDRPEMKPYYLDESSLLIIICLITTSFTNFSMILQMIEVRLTGR